MQVMCVAGRSGGEKKATRVFSPVVSLWREEWPEADMGMEPVFFMVGRG